MNTAQTSLRDEAVIAAPFGALVLVSEGSLLVDIALQPVAAAPTKPTNPLLQEAVRQFEAYFDDPGWRFSLPLPDIGTAYQQKVWQALLAIPPGTARSYAAIATELHSAPRAVAGACRANHFPLVIPCHRVVASHGLGGYCGAVAGPFLDIKRWLLRHEGYEF